MSQGQSGGAGARALPSGPWITCRDVLERLYDYLDGELTAAWERRVARHLDGCPDCRARLVFERSFLEAVRRGRAPTVARTALSILTR
jgi:anti-sigma factor RsiW